MSQKPTKNQDGSYTYEGVRITRYRGGFSYRLVYDVNSIMVYPNTLANICDKIDADIAQGFTVKNNRVHTKKEI